MLYIYTSNMQPRLVGETVQSDLQHCTMKNTRVQLFCVDSHLLVVSLIQLDQLKTSREGLNILYTIFIASLGYVSWVCVYLCVCMHLCVLVRGYVCLRTCVCVCLLHFPFKWNNLTVCLSSEAAMVFVWSCQLQRYF